MHRIVLVLLLIPALTATSGALPSLHTHLYGEHDHPEHHHGPAAHQHYQPAEQTNDRAHLEACDPGEHAISFVFLRAAPPQAASSDAELILPATPGLELHNDRSVRRMDVRVHGPPPSTYSSPRAPPLIAHA